MGGCIIPCISCGFTIPCCTYGDEKLRTHCLLGHIPLKAGYSILCAGSNQPGSGLYLAGSWVRGFTRTVKRDSPRWYHCSPSAVMVCASYTLRGRLLVIHCGTPRLRMPPMEEGMAMAHMMHLAFPRCCGAPLEPSGNCSFHSYPAGTAVGAAAPGASCVPFVNAAASPSCMARRVWMRGTTRTRQRVIPRGCMCATANPLVPTGWDLAGITLGRSWGWIAGYTLRGRLRALGGHRGPPRAG